ncbi:MAG: hypothetical protein ACTSVB_00830 [Candidatus Heimdallarchaeaceae archaeon]
MIEIIAAIVGAIGFPLWIWFVKFNTDALETVVQNQPTKKNGKIIWFCLAVLGGTIGWFIGKGLDKLWEVLVS